MKKFWKKRSKKAKPAVPLVAEMDIPDEYFRLKMVRDRWIKGGTGGDFEKSYFEIFQRIEQDWATQAKSDDPDDKELQQLSVRQRVAIYNNTAVVKSQAGKLYIDLLGKRPCLQTISLEAKQTLDSMATWSLANFAFINYLEQLLNDLERYWRTRNRSKLCKILTATVALAGFIALAIATSGGSVLALGSLMVVSHLTLGSAGITLATEGINYLANRPFDAAEKQYLATQGEGSDGELRGISRFETPKSGITHTISEAVKGQANRQALARKAVTTTAKKAATKLLGSAGGTVVDSADKAQKIYAQVKDYRQADQQEVIIANNLTVLMTRIAEIEEELLNLRQKAMSHSKVIYASGKLVQDFGGLNDTLRFVQAKKKTMDSSIMALHQKIISKAMRSGFSKAA